MITRSYKALTSRPVFLLAAALAILMLAAPLVFAETKTFMYAEDRTDEVATFSASDQDGNAIEWGKSGDDAGEFKVTPSEDGLSAVLTFAEQPNFEDPANERGDNVYKVTVTASGGSIDVEVTVTDVDEPGKPTLTKPQPQVGRGLEAEGPFDPDEPVTDVLWQWAKSMDMETWEDIGSPSASGSRNPVDADIGYYLRATAMYTDKHGSGKTAPVTSENAVEARTRANARPNFDDHEDSDGDATNGKQIARSVDENAKGAEVGKPITAKDDDDALLYELTGAGDEAEDFGINERTGQITTKKALDSNADSADADDTEDTHTVTVTVKDPSGADASVTVVITVNNVNDAPMFDDDAPKTLYVLEGTGRELTTDEAGNAALTADADAYVATDDDAADGPNATPTAAFTYSVGGADKDSFDLSATGVLSIDADHDPDYEDQKEYSITLMVEDDEFAMGKVDVTVKVRDAEDDGEVKLNAREPQAGKSVLATLSDDDGVVGTVTWQWARVAESDVNVACPDAGDNSYDDITGATSANYTPKAGEITSDAGDEDGDVNACLQVTATYTDGFDRTDEEDNPDTAMKVTERAVQAENPANTAPEFAKDQDLSTPGDQAVAVRSVAENMDKADVGAPVVADDADLLMYAVDDTTNFSVNNDGQIKTKVKLDYETKDEYMVTLTAMDPSGADHTVMVKIMVTDGPDDAVITGVKTYNYAEDRTDEVATFNASDQDGNAIEWGKSGDDAGEFKVTPSEDGLSAVLTFAEQPNFEDPANERGDNVYKVTVTASGGSIDVEVTVTDVDEPGKPTLTKPQPQVGRGLEAEGPFDPDEPVTDVKWQWAKSMDMETWEDIGNASASGSRNPVDADIGYYLRATAMYTDKHGPGKTAPVTSENKVEERTVANAQPSFSDHADSHTDTGLQIARMVDENAKDAQVGKPITAKDDDDALLYELEDPDTATTPDMTDLFKINERTGQITTKIALDSSSTAGTQDTTDDTDADEVTHRVTVKATDPSGATGMVTVDIMVNNVNDAPMFDDDAPKTLYVLEGTGRELTTDEAGNAALTADADAYVATDDDAADGPNATPTAAFTYSVGGTDKDSFDLSATGVLSIDADHDPDYEDQKEYSITLMVEDDEFAMGKVDVTVKVRDAEDDGEVKLNAREPQAGKSVLATLSDDDGVVGTVTWQWARVAESDVNVACPDAGDNSYDDITGATSANYTPKAGEITSDAGDEDGDVNACLQVTATYTDGFDRTDEEDNPDTAMKVTERAVQAEDPANTAPEFAKDQDLSTPGDQAVAVRSVAENMDKADVGAPVVADDADLLMYAVDDTTNFSVNNDGQIKTKVKLDYETKDEYMVTLTAMDPSGADHTVMVKIMVTDGPDDATITLGLVVNNAPAFDDGSSTTRMVAENAAAGAYVGDPVTAMDADDDSLTYSLSGSMYFDVNDDGQIMVADGAMLDYEMDDMHTVTVTASDGEDMDTIMVTIMVTDMYPGCGMQGGDAANMYLNNDCEALLDSKDALGGSLNWDEAMPINDWDGIQGHSMFPSLSGDPMRVTALHLQKGDLDGMIPDALGRLSALTYLNVHSNSLQGMVPGALGMLTNLEQLYLNNNELDGTIGDLSGASSLEILWLKSNQLTGGIPSELGSLSNLKELRLFNNPDLGGEIPMELGSLSSLTLLVVQDTGLTGEIPMELGNLSNLMWLGLYNNELSGSIPMELGSLSNLEVLYLHYNELSGEVPSELGSLSMLTNLWLKNNSGLSGQLPMSLDSLTNLERVRINRTGFSGCVPAALANAPDTDAAMLNLPTCQ